MTENDFTSFGFLEKGFSAHPKIDPDNGDIYNIGFNMGSFDIFRMNKDFKLIAKNNAKLKINQSIHDCCLAGDYLVAFENPLKIDMWKLLKAYEPLKCYSVDYNYGKTIVHIFKKENLELVKRMEISGP
jgi:all-trans-8'-apo-beta-carotenal 15,15'-oxygenase